MVRPMYPGGPQNHIGRHAASCSALFSEEDSAHTWQATTGQLYNFFESWHDIHVHYSISEGSSQKTCVPQWEEGASHAGAFSL